MLHRDLQAEKTRLLRLMTPEANRVLTWNLTVIVLLGSGLFAFQFWDLLHNQEQTEYLIHSDSWRFFEKLRADRPLQDYFFHGVHTFAKSWRASRTRDAADAGLLKRPRKTLRPLPWPFLMYRLACHIWRAVSK